MAGGAVAAEGLVQTLGRAEPTVVQRSWDYKDLGNVEVLLTPKDVARRSRRTFWHYGRPKFALGHPVDRPGRPLATGLFEGSAAFPNKCATCLAEPSTGVVYEMQGNLLKGGSARFRANDRRVVIAANWERIWYSVPYCEAHAGKPNSVAFGESSNNLGWITFRNAEYATEFGELNGIGARRFARRWWAALLFVAALLLLLGGGIISQVAGEDNAVDDLIVAAVFLVAGLGLLWYLYAQLVGPWRAARRTTGKPTPSDARPAGAHRDRGDGYCNHCFQPWPCPGAREAGVR